MSKKQVAVIGAGAAGLTCAWRLARWGFAVTLFDAAPRLGGVVAPLSCGTLRFARAASYLDRLLSRGVLARQGLTPLSLTDDRQPAPWRRWPLSWLRLIGWGRRFPDRPLAAAPVAGPFGDWLATVTEPWTGEPLATLTWLRLAPLVGSLLRPPYPFGWAVSGKPSEWLAVALARAIGQMGHAVHVATPVTALIATADGWGVATHSLALQHAQAVVLAIPPDAAAALLPAAAGGRLRTWPIQPQWGVPQPRPVPVGQPVTVAPRCWVAGGWLPPEGALPGLDGAVGSGWMTARAVRTALLAS